MQLRQLVKLTITGRLGIKCIESEELQELQEVQLVKLTITRRLGIECIESEELQELQEVQLVKLITVTSQKAWQKVH